jgi:outer membrane immunogenic protein
MRKTIVGILLGTGIFCSASANAADMARPLPAPVAAPPFTWTGLYSGAHGGYGFGDLTATSLGINLTPLPEPTGFFFGSNIGYNWQVANFVIGVEADFNYGHIEDSVTILTVPGATAGATSRLDYFGTARGRLGFAFGNVLIYGTGGVAWGHNNATLDVAAFGLGTRLFDDQNHLGWTAGGGFEYAINNSWSIKAEYLYLDFGDEAYTFVTGPVVPLLGVAPPSANVDLKLHTVKVGANFKFDLAGLFSGR